MECNAHKLVELSLASLMSIEKEKNKHKKGLKKRLKKEAKEGTKEAKIMTIKYLNLHSEA
jgi:hypothetical protein